MNKMKQAVETVVPFLLVGVLLTLSVAFFVLIAYLVFWGLLIGLVLYAIFWVKERFFPAKSARPSSIKGRVIEHDTEK